MATKETLKDRGTKGTQKTLEESKKKINFHLGYFWITLGILCILGTPLCLLIRLYKLGLEEPSKESIKDTKEDK